MSDTRAKVAYPVGLEKFKATASSIGTMQEESRIGQNVPRIDAFEKVVGAAKFTVDMKIQGMLYARILKSPHAHAKIMKIDARKAQMLRGVKAILTGKEIPLRIGIYVADRDVLARDKVRWVGDPVVAVAATSEEIAEEAVNLIKVEYKELKPVFDPRDAMKENAPLVHEKLHEYIHSPVFLPIPHTNIANDFKLKKGDIEKGFKEAEIIVESEFAQPQVDHVCMETHVCIGQYLPDGAVNLWTSAQSPFAVRYLLGISLGIPLHKINVHVPYVGGGFGGKAGINLEPLVVFLSKKAGGRPVKFVPTREEQFTCTPSRCGMYAKVKTGVKKNGRITAEKIEYVWDAGAYADYAVNVGRAAGYTCAGPYDIPNIEGSSKTVYTNHPYGASYRGFGHLELLWAIERQMDIVARRLCLDPVEFRMKNILRPGSTTATGEQLREDAGRLDLCIEAVANSLQLRKKEKTTDPAKVRGKGIAAICKAPAIPPNASSSAIIKFNEDGSAVLLIGEAEFGQGTSTAMAQIASEELGLPIEKIKTVCQKDTDSSPYNWQSVASRGTFMCGNAVIAACSDAREQIKGIAAQVLRVQKEALRVAEERVFLPERPEVGLSLKQVVMGYTYPNGNSIGQQVIGRGGYIATGMTNLDPQTGQGRPAIKWTFGAHGAEVEIDTETGQIRIVRMVSAFDIGRAINPDLVKGQIYGAVVQGIGVALMEQYICDEKGVLVNDNLADYKIARISDIPEEHIPIMIQTPQEDGPYGARGIGELALIGVPSAIGNAVCDAIGVEMMDLPITSERIWEALVRKGK